MVRVVCARVCAAHTPTPPTELDSHHFRRRKQQLKIHGRPSTACLCSCSCSCLFVWMWHTNLAQFNVNTSRTHTHAHSHDHIYEKRRMKTITRQLIQIVLILYDKFLLFFFRFWVPFRAFLSFYVRTWRRTHSDFQHQSICHTLRMTRTLIRWIGEREIESERVRGGKGDWENIENGKTKSTDK